MSLIFQYGSNCDGGELNNPKRLNRTAADRGRALTVREWEIAFNKWSTDRGCAAADLVEPERQGRRIWGVLYDVSDEGLKKLKDDIEGPSYEPKGIEVINEAGETQTAITFLVKPDARREGLWTSSDYVRHIVDGLRGHDVSEDYVWHVIGVALKTNQSAEDAEAARREMPAIRRLRGMLLSPNYSVRHWRELAFTSEPDWQRAIDIVEDRIRGRFIRWIDQLVGQEFAGFATVALDCLLLETLYGFQAGCSTKDTLKAYKSVLMAAPLSFEECLAKNFYDNIRCGIIHDTETRKGWLIRMDTEETVRKDQSGNLVLNRTMFHERLKEAFEAWITKLRGGDVALRENMRCRMDEIIKKHYEL